MSTPDVNLFSLTAEHSGGSRRSFLVDARGRPDIADAYKFSNVRNYLSQDFTVHGGYEDCIDANRGGNLSWVNGHLHIGGKYGCTLKGGLDGYWLESIVFFNKPSAAHIELGNWSDQAQSFDAKTKNGVLRNVRTADGSPLIISVLNADKPQVIDCDPITWRVTPRLLVWAFWTIRRNKWGFGA
jgi:hypothetical protein